ncbi:MAG: alpha/beta hydrolase [Bacteroidales bacterium]|nr:alpha/beta hydrolase [Bacteroidales bacterium]
MDIKTDVLGNGFKSLEYIHSDDYEGEVKSVVVFRDTEQSSSKAVLYVHGYIDYFFQQELADHFNKWGYNFYAVDLRKYGRALMPHQKPNFARNMDEYFEDLDSAIAKIKEDKNTEMILMGHSTGGLLTSLYLNKQKDGFIKALMLNSPFFDLNIPNALRSVLGIPMWLGKHFENLNVDFLTQHYPKSLHKDYKGEWDFNIAWKPIVNFPFYFTWMRAIRLAQIELHKGLDIKQPVLVMHSDKSYKGRKWSEDIRMQDAVLDVEHIAKYAKVIGKDVTTIEIEGAVHDMVLSKLEVRKRVYDEMFNWLELKALV